MQAIDSHANGAGVMSAAATPAYLPSAVDGESEAHGDFMARIRAMSSAVHQPAPTSNLFTSRWSSAGAAHERPMACGRRS